MKSIKVRAIYRATTVSGYHAPFDTLSLKVYYPCNTEHPLAAIADHK